MAEITSASVPPASVGPASAGPASVGPAAGRAKAGRAKAGRDEPAHPTRHSALPTPRSREVGLDFAREWFTFTDPADAEHLIRLDLTWLCSRWTCIFGRGCHGVVADRPDDGCCTHGAFFSDTQDEKRALDHARSLTPADWQHYAAGHVRGRLAVVETEPAADGVDDETRRRTRLVDGACIFLNRPGFDAGAGCALHTLALRTGLNPVATKPEVCWQLPMRREQEWVDRPDETRVLMSTVTEFDRRGWGEGGHDLYWYCSGAPEAHVAATPLFERYGAELTELIGAPAYAQLVRVCRARLDSSPDGRLVAEHPATAQTRSDPAR